MAKVLKGVIPPIITPVDENEKVDETALRKLVDHCIDHGIHGIFVTGSNGECMALTQQERNHAIKVVLDEAGGRVPVMAGVMDSSTQRVIDNVKAFEDMGGEYAVITPVFYARHATQQETVRLFEDVAKHTQCKLLIYNIPPFTGQLLKAETIFEIAKIDQVVGYKDTSGNFPDFIKCLRYFKGTDFHLFQGATNLAIPSLLMGADGYIPSLAPLFPRPYVKMYEAAQQKDYEAVMEWGKIVDETCKIYPMAKSQTSSTKYALSKLGFLDKRVIRPTEPITPEEERRIDQKIEELKEYLG